MLVVAGLDPQSAVALVVGGVVAAVFLAQRFGLIPAGPVVKSAQQRADEAEKELLATAARLDAERSHRREAELRTDIRPIVAELQKLADAQAKVLEKLAKLNGGLDRSAKGLEQATEALRFVASTLVTDMREKP